MAGFSFKIRLPKSKRGTILVGEPSVRWPLGDGLPELILSSGNDKVPLKDAEAFYFKSEGWSSKDEARAAADKYVSALARTLARLRVGVDFGARTSKGGGISHYLIDKMWNEHGLRLINDTPGVIIYESEPQPVFSSTSESYLQLGVSRRSFESVFAEAIARDLRLTPRESISLDLFNASFFQKSPDTRFLMLMIALEALLDPAPRSVDAVNHVKGLIASTKAAESLSNSEKQSICSSLAWLLKESIGYTARKLIKMQLGERQYLDMPADKFFTHCYTLRSRLVHGLPPLPIRDEIGMASASLEVLVSDLLAAVPQEIPAR